MAIARSNQIDLSATPYYHCMTRCVRRSYLCGQDQFSGKDYSHRKPWIVARIKHLASVFSIHICAYAIMSNHYHLVLHVNEALALQWSEDEVLQRWAQIFPNDAKLIGMYSNKEAKRKLALWRQRLTDISWYMRCLNEKIARASNKEDETKGRFWEGRFKSQALLDEGALLSAMVYVDLNPIRAKMADSLESSDFTSIQERLRMLATQLKSSKTINNTQQPKHLMPLINHKQKNIKQYPSIDFKLSDYLELIDSTGRVLRAGKRGVIPQSMLPILTRLQLNPNEWINMVRHLQSRFSYAIGHSAILIAFNKGCRIHGPKGINVARKCFIAA